MKNYIFPAVVMLAFATTSAHANESFGIADRMLLQCPQVSTLILAGDRSTYTLKHGKSKTEAEKCLKLAYAEILKNPYPVNTTVRHATKATILPNGKIRLE